MRLFLRFIGGFALFAATATASSAATLYDSGVALTRINAALSSDAADPSAPLGAQKATFATDVALTGAQWTGAYSNASSGLPSDAFTLDIYSDVADAPGAAPIGSAAMIANRVLTPITFAGSAVYEYDSVFTALGLGAGTYWFAVTNDTTGANTPWSWTLDATGSPGDGYFAGQPGLVIDFDLTLFGDEVAATVPLPASLPAMASALLLLGIWRRGASLPK